MQIPCDPSALNSKRCLLSFGGAPEVWISPGAGGLGPPGPLSHGGDFAGASNIPLGHLAALRGYQSQQTPALPLTASVFCIGYNR
jgi:hypothetical protein